MKRFISIALFLVMILAMAIPAGAALTATRITPSLEFFNGRAYYDLDIVAEYGDEISAKVELFQGATRVAVWEDSGEDALTIAGSYRAVSGSRYTMYSTVEINGVEVDVNPVTKTCP